MKFKIFHHLTIEFWPYSLTFIAVLICLLYAFQMVLQLHTLFWSYA